MHRDDRTTTFARAEANRHEARAEQKGIGMLNRYDRSKPLHDLEGWIVFYGQQAQRIENDPTMAEVFQASCETVELLLELQGIRSGLTSA